MTFRRKVCLLAAVGLSFGVVSPLLAQDYASTARLEEVRDESLYYQQPPYRAVPRDIIFQKAQTRALQRQARLASLSWANMSTARPASASTPFTTRSGPLWLAPSSRPVAWHSSGWPTYVYFAR